MLLALMCALIAVWEVRRARSAVHLETGYVGLGGDAGEYFWLPVPEVKSDQARLELQRAKDHTPSWGWAHYVSGKGRRLAFENQRRLAVEENVGRLHGADKADVRQAVHLALRIEEAVAARDAAHDLEQARRLSPWHADTHAALSSALFRWAAAETEPSRAEQLALTAGSEARRAAWLAPNDAFTLATVCTALSVGLRTRGNRDREEDEALLREWGAHALRLRGKAENAVLKAWHESGIPILDILSTSELPLGVLLRTYRFYDGLSSGRHALECLRALRRTCSSTHASVPSFKERQQQEGVRKFRVVAVREEAKWLLRLGRWDDYRNLLEEREAVHKAVIAREMERFEETGLSGDLLYVKLRALARTVGLDEQRQLQLCRLQVEQGHQHAASEQLAEVALREHAPIDLLQQALRPPSNGIEDTLGGRLARARDLMTQSVTAAESQLRSILEDKDLPYRFRHRIRFLLSRCMIEDGRFEAARETLLKAASECPTDVTTLRAIAELGGTDWRTEDQSGSHRIGALLEAVAPVHRVGMQFLGGEAELMGLSLRQTRQQAPHLATLSLFWRFWGAVPADLEALIHVADEEGYVTFSRANGFAQSEPVNFSAGMPQIGRVTVMEVQLPARARIGSRLTVKLWRRSDRTPVPSIEGLKQFEVWDWQKLVSEPEPAPDQNSSASAPSEP